MEIDENKTVCSFLLDEFQAEDREELAIRLKENVDIDTICEAMLKYGVYVMKRFHKQIKS